MYEGRESIVKLPDGDDEAEEQKMREKDCDIDNYMIVVDNYDFEMRKIEASKPLKKRSTLRGSMSPMMRSKINSTPEDTMNVSELVHDKSIEPEPLGLVKRSSVEFSGVDFKMYALRVDHSSKRVLQEADFSELLKLHFSLTKMKTMFNKRVNPKTIVDYESGQVIVLYADNLFYEHKIDQVSFTPESYDHMKKWQLLDGELPKEKLDISLTVLRLNANFNKHFQGKDRAIMIDGKIFVKGPVSSMVAIRKKDQDKFDQDME